MAFPPASGRQISTGRPAGARLSRCSSGRASVAGPLASNAAWSASIGRFSTSVSESRCLTRIRRWIADREVPPRSKKSRPPDPAGRQPEHLGPQGGELVLQGRGRRLEGLAGRDEFGRPFREPALVGLAVLAERELRQAQVVGRQHVLRQPGRHQVVQIDGRELVLRDVAADEPGAVALADHRDRGRGDARHAQQSRGDVTDLHAQPADLHLVVESAEKLQAPLRQPAAAVAGAVEPLTGHERVAVEGSGRTVRVVDVATWDRYGGDRPGDNLFSSSVVALDARTGQRLWHFQLVHHDIWDLDTQAPPLLLDIRRRRITVPAVAIVSKGGYFFLLDRRTGEPLLDVRERPVPASELPGERAARTQPIPVTPPPFARTEFSPRDVATVTPELEAYCRGLLAEHGMLSGGPYLPIGRTPTIHFPGRLGGANWGGGSYDPARGLFLVNASNLGHVEQLTPRNDGTLTNAGAATGRFSDRERKLPCQQPPWGTLTAINVRTGRIAWQSTLGVSDQLPPAVARTGRPNIGGSIATAGGVVFIGATDDARFRAFSTETGEELWSTKLRASAHATPITYRGRSGKQYVAIVATGGSFLDSPIDSDELAVFALP